MPQQAAGKPSPCEKQSPDALRSIQRPRENDGRIKSRRGTLTCTDCPIEEGPIGVGDNGYVQTHCDDRFIGKKKSL